MGYCVISCIPILLCTCSTSINCSRWLNTWKHWNISRIVVFCVMFFSSSTIIISIMIIAASSAFWIRNSFSILSFAFKIKDYSRYPVTIFEGVLRYFLTFVIPVAFTGYYPVLILVRPEEVEPVLFFAPVLSLVFFFFAYKIWERGVRIYDGTGS